MYERCTQPLERSPAITGLAAQATRLVPKPERCSPGVSEAAVSQWLRRARKGGAEALRRYPSLDEPRRLTEELLLACRRDPCGIWHLVSSTSCRPLVQGRAVESAITLPRRPPTPRSRDCPVVSASGHWQVGRPSCGNGRPAIICRRFAPFHRRGNSIATARTVPSIRWM